MAEDDVDYGRATITLSIDGSDADSDGRAAGVRLQRALLNATRRTGDAIRRQIQRGLNAQTLTVRVEPDLSRFDSALLTGLRSLSSVNVPVAPDVTGFVERLRALLADVEIPIRVVPDLDDFDARIRAHNAPTVNVNVNPDVNAFQRALAGLSRVASIVGRGLTSLLSFGAIGIAAAGAAVGIGAFLAALAPAAGIVAALPAAVAAAQVAMGTLRLAVLGVSDALGAALSGDAAAFSEALEKLSPAAQKAVTAVRDLAPRLKEVQQSIQQSFFKEFAGDVEGAITNLLPLGSELNKVSTEFGKAASEGLKFAASQQAAGPLRQIIQGTAQAASGLQTAIAPLAKGFLDVAAAVLQAFGPQVGAGIGQVGAQIGTALSAFAASGRAVEAVRGALVVFQQLGAIASNVGSIIGGVFDAANASGGGFLNNLQTITASFAQFVNSAAGQEAIGNIFSTLAVVAAQLGPILAALVTQIGQIAPMLAPVFATLGPAIVGVINALGPAIQGIAPSLQVVAAALAEAFGAIGPSLGPLGAAIGQIVAALAPVLPMVGQLAGVFASALAPILGSLAPLIGVVVSAFGQVLPILGQLVSAIGSALAPIIAALLPVFQQLLGPVVQLAQTLGAALMPVIQALGPIIAALVPALLQVFLAFNPVLNVIFNLLPVLSPIIGLIGQLGAWFLRLITPLIQLIAPIVTVIAQFFAVNRAIGVVIGWIGRLVGWTTRMWGAITTAATRIGTAISRIVGFFSSLLGRVGSVLTSLGVRVASLFLRVMARAGSAVSSGIGRVVSFFSSLMSRAASAVSSGISRVVGFFSALTGRVRSALSGAGSALVSVGRALVTGLISGVRAMAGSVARTARRVVAGAISAAKETLGISSPSKVFAQIGRDTGAGFVKGLTGTADQIKQTAEKIIKQITDAFKGRRTRVDDRLVAMLKSGNKELQSLAAQRDKLVQRIADAQKFAADTSKAALDAFSLQNLTQGEGPVTVKGLAQGLQDGIDQVRKFTAQINNLAKRGLNKDLLAQIIGLGPVQGAEIAAALSQTSKDSLKRLSSLQSQLSKATGALGTTSADVLYDAGKQAGKGFLAGLKAQRKSIETLMLDIAKSMQAAIRRALRIKSPSVVMRKLGEMTAAGLRLGLVRQMSAVEAASRLAARAVVRGVSSQMAGLADVTPSLGGQVVPLTRSQRLRTAGTDPRTPARSGRRGGGDVVHNHTWNIREVGNARTTATRVLNRFVLAAGVG
ncbi:hypothetical protein ACFY64_32090 [Streptomyces collinus]|uniref:hypothetical protein n=1 Tax=Streptomyces collinus TaxID=42684 RepID=UPI0036750165